MKIEAARDGGSAVLQLEGRLDREWAEHLSDTLEDLLQDGVRSLSIDFSGVTYVSSAATKVLTRWQQELALLRGEVQLISLPPVAREVFEIAGWDSTFGSASRSGPRSGEMRRSYWHTRADIAANGDFELSACTPAGTLTCRVIGDSAQITRGPIGPDHCQTVSFPDSAFGLGIGAIGGDYDECRERLGELIGVAGGLAYFPSDGARMADYLVSGGPRSPRALLASGLVCEGGFSQLVRFSVRQEAEAVPISEVAAIALEATGGAPAGFVVAGETVGLCGARLRRSPAKGESALQFDVPAVRDWLWFAPERTHAVTTSLIAGVVARKREGQLAEHLRPLTPMNDLFGHIHAAVFSYHPLPKRTVELTALLRGLFANHQLRDVLHLVWDDRTEGAIGESALLRGVGWIAPITQFN
jgi:anti-sigma B factor antagonist